VDTALDDSDGHHAHRAAKKGIDDLKTPERIDHEQVEKEVRG